MSDISEFFHAPSENFGKTEFVGGIFPRKHVSIIAAKSGCGKTWYILKLIADLSQGGTIFNSQAYYEPPRKSILFAGETGLELVSERFSQMHDKPADKNVIILSRIELLAHGINIDLSHPQTTAPIVKVIENFHPDIIFFDTLMSFRSDEENKMQQTNKMMSRLQYLAQNYNIAVVCTHHVRKRSKDDVSSSIDQDEIIGSSAIVRQSACAYILKRYGRNYALHPVKTWWRMEQPIEYRMENDSSGQVVFSEPTDTGYNSTNKRLRVEVYIKTQREPFTITEVTQKFRIDRATASTIIKSLNCVEVDAASGSNPAKYIYGAYYTQDNG